MLRRRFLQLPLAFAGTSLAQVAQPGSVQAARQWIRFLHDPQRRAEAAQRLLGWAGEDIDRQGQLLFYTTDEILRLKGAAQRARGI